MLTLMPQREKSFVGMPVLIVFLSFFVFSSGQVEAQNTVRQLTPPTAANPLAKLLALALENSPEILNAKRTLDSARLERANSTAELLPKLDLDSTHGIADSNPRQGKDNPWTSQLKLGLSETFYDNGESITKRTIAIRKEQRSEIEYELEKNLALTNLAEAYFDWSKAFQNLRIQEEQRVTVDRQFTLIRNQYRQGVRSRRDVLRIESQARSNQIQRITAENDIKIAELALSRLVGIPVTQFQQVGILPYGMPKGWTPPPLPPPIAAKDHPQARAIDLAVQEADLTANLSTRENGPRLGVEGNVAYNAAGYMGTGRSISDIDFVDWSALVTLKYNLFDFGIRSRNAQLARIEAGRVRDTKRGEYLGLDNELRTQYILLKQSRDNIQLTKELLDVDMQSFAAQERDYRNGRAQFTDLSEALRSLVDTKSSYSSTFFEFKKQQVNYAYHQGRVEEFFLAQ
jgi:outer membrane protein TolC